MREITLDMAPNMEQIARICFPAAKRVTDRFHVQKVAYEAVQDRSDRMNVRTFNDGNHTTFTTVSFFIGQYSIEFPTREGYLINTDISTDILFE